MQEDEISTKNKILDAADSLFQDISYSKTSVANIASKAGIGKGTVYFYYRSKLAILEEIIQTNLAVLSEKILQVFSNADFSFNEKINKFIDYLVDILSRIRTLTFGKFRNLDANVLRDVVSLTFSSGCEEEVRNVLFQVMVQQGLVKEDERADFDPLFAEFINLLIGRALLYLIYNSWDDLEPLRALLREIAVTLLYTVIQLKKKEYEL